MQLGSQGRLCEVRRGEVVKCAKETRSNSCLILLGGGYRRRSAAAAACTAALSHP